MARRRATWQIGAVARRLSLTLMWLAACTATPVAPEAPPASTGSPLVAPASQSAATTPPMPTTTPAPEPEPAPVVPTVKLRSWTRSHEAPVISLGIGKRRIAVLTPPPSATAWLRDGDKWREIAFPEALRLPEGFDNRARMFFGRDDRPRLMGIYAAPRADGTTAARAIYYRYKGGWRKEPKEIGHLAKEPAVPLFGILGHDDPEVVCKLGGQCIIKRLTGWTMVKAGTEPFWTELDPSDKGAWGVAPHQLVRITNDGWADHGGRAPYAQAGGVWGERKGTVWVSEPATGKLHAFDGKIWTSTASPVRAPRGLFGSSTDDVWVVGEDGAGHFDGKGWSRVEGPKGPLVEVRGAPDGSLWMAGGSGTWLGTE
jgi:hypothetical protein